MVTLLPLCLWLSWRQLSKPLVSKCHRIGLRLFMLSFCYLIVKFTHDLTVSLPKSLCIANYLFWHSDCWSFLVLLRLLLGEGCTWKRTGVSLGSPEGLTGYRKQAYSARLLGKSNWWTQYRKILRNWAVSGKMQGFNCWSIMENITVFILKIGKLRLNSKET